ncbi:SubName: Full=Uncharacterized protein {ECO:0000313/EMBL:CCA66700.1} [Serendipita indica DSM 11827]|nr:SubName: Full=Uncharacterized protein {ECO:0000313/EMBL:CCA66700.1} [Serendipita indica DSM 11827]
MSTYLTQLRGQHHALQLLLLAYSYTLDSMRLVLDNLSPSLNRIRADTESLTSRRRRLTPRSSIGTMPGVAYNNGSRQTFSSSILSDVGTTSPAGERERSGRHAHAMDPIGEEDNYQVPNPAGFNGFTPPAPPNGWSDSSSDHTSTQAFSPRQSSGFQFPTNSGHRRSSYETSRSEVTLEELRILAGPHHWPTLSKTVDLHGITVVAPLFRQIRSFGTGEHFHASLLSLKRHNFEIIHVAGALKQLRHFGEETDYSYVMQYLSKHEYDIDKTLVTFLDFNRLFSTKEAYGSALTLLEKYNFDSEKMMNAIRVVSEPSSRGEATYCSLMGFISSRGFNMSIVGREFPLLMAANWKQTPMGLKRLPITEDILLREEATLKLLERNSYDVTLTISQIDSLCGEDNASHRGATMNPFRRRPSAATKSLRSLSDVSSSVLDTSSIAIDISSAMSTEDYRNVALFVCLLPDRPRLPLKVLQKANYDYRRTLGGIQWLKNINKTPGNLRKALEYGQYNISEIRSLHTEMTRMIPRPIHLPSSPVSPGPTPQISPQLHPSKRLHNPFAQQRHSPIYKAAHLQLPSPPQSPAPSSVTIQHAQNASVGIYEVLDAHDWNFGQAIAMLRRLEQRVTSSVGLNTLIVQLKGVNWDERRLGTLLQQLHYQQSPPGHTRQMNSGVPVPESGYPSQGQNPSLIFPNDDGSSQTQRPGMPSPQFNNHEPYHPGFGSASLADQYAQEYPSFGPNGYLSPGFPSTPVDVPQQESLFDRIPRSYSPSKVSRRESLFD